MIIADKSSYSSDIYYGIVVNTSSSDDPEGLDRIQIYIPSVQYEYANRYEEYMNSSNKTELEDFGAYPWASTLVSGGLPPSVCAWVSRASGTMPR